ncbi:MAG TPA: HD domain-containing protein [Kofleriaceae bacterium]|nr:HD domain-containing protein [Kofleriaceae bacterium]
MTPAMPQVMKDRVFRDPVHGLIEFRGLDRDLQTVLETWPVQRLRRIKQDGFAWLVYPGAEHSRFGHALGAFHIAQRVTRELGLEPVVARHVKLAALLHDVGHGPFSHAWEHALGGDSHEAWGARIVAEDPELSVALEAIEPGLPGTLQQFWTKQYRPRFACKLVSSQLDVDRLDYLLRDGHYSGAGYATFDLDWILHALRVERVHDSPDGDDLVVDYRRGMFAVEQYLFARSYMYAQVYHHKTVRAAEWMFVKTLERFAMLARAGAEPPGLEIAGGLARGERLEVADYLRLDDHAVTVALDQWAGRRGPGAADPVLRDLAQRLITRRLFKIIDLGDDPAVLARVSPEVERIGRDHFGDDARFYYHLDHASQVGYTSGDDEELHVVGHPRHGVVTLGQLLAELPLGRPITRVRLMCAPELLEALRPVAAAAVTSSD